MSHSNSSKVSTPSTVFSAEALTKKLKRLKNSQVEIEGML
jgi:hypothetical protein